MKKFKNIEDYIRSYPKSVQGVLKKVRQIVRKVAPKADESMSYGMPGYKLNGKPLVYFAGWQSHLGFYPIPSGIKAFKKELASYRTAKGSVQFPIDKTPYGLIERIVRFRVKENLAIKNH